MLAQYADLLVSLGQGLIVLITLGMLNPASDKKPPLFVCIGTTAGMLLVTFGLLGAGLLFGIVVSGLVTLQWILITVQRYQINNGRRVLFTGLWIRWDNFMGDLDRLTAE